MPEHSETTGWKIWTVKDGAETKWFLVDKPIGEASVLLQPVGSNEALYGEVDITLYVVDSGMTVVIVPESREGEEP